MIPLDGRVLGIAMHVLLPCNASFQNRCLSAILSPSPVSRISRLPCSTRNYRGFGATALKLVADRSSTGSVLRSRWYNSAVPDTAGFMHLKDSAVNHIALDKEDEAIKRFVLSLPVDTNGAVLELEGRALACVVPVVAEPPGNSAGASEKRSPGATNR